MSPAGPATSPTASAPKPPPPAPAPAPAPKPAATPEGRKADAQKGAALLTQPATVDSTKSTRISPEASLANQKEKSKGEKLKDGTAINTAADQPKDSGTNPHQNIVVTDKHREAIAATTGELANAAKSGSVDQAAVDKAIKAGDNVGGPDRNMAGPNKLAVSEQLHQNAIDLRQGSAATVDKAKGDEKQPAADKAAALAALKAEKGTLEAERLILESAKADKGDKHGSTIDPAMDNGANKTNVKREKADIDARQASITAELATNQISTDAVLRTVTAEDATEIKKMNGGPGQPPKVDEAVKKQVSEAAESRSPAKRDWANASPETKAELVKLAKENGVAVATPRTDQATVVAAAKEQGVIPENMTFDAQGQGSYTVKPGESYWRISETLNHGQFDKEQFNVLMAANAPTKPVKDPTIIYTGQKLTVPGYTTEALINVPGLVLPTDELPADQVVAQLIANGQSDALNALYEQETLTAAGRDGAP